MANYDMSQTACQERVKAARRLDKIEETIEILSQGLQDLATAQTASVDAMKTLHKMVNLNHETIKEIKKC